MYELEEIKIGFRLEDTFGKYIRINNTSGEAWSPIREVAIYGGDVPESTYNSLGSLRLNDKIIKGFNAAFLDY